jgi:hypothetical protein
VTNVRLKGYVCATRALNLGWLIAECGIKDGSGPAFLSDSSAPAIKWEVGAGTNSNTKSSANSGGALDFEATLWAAADKPRSNRNFSTHEGFRKKTHSLHFRPAVSCG